MRVRWVVAIIAAGLIVIATVALVAYPLASIMANEREILSRLRSSRVQRLEIWEVGMQELIATFWYQVTAGKIKQEVKTTRNEGESDEDFVKRHDGLVAEAIKGKTLVDPPK